MKVAILTTDSREHYRDYERQTPFYGAAPTALLAGLSNLPGCEVHVISCLKEQVTPTNSFAPNIRSHSLKVRGAGWLKSGYLGCVLATRKKLSEIRPDIVHGQGTERDCALAAVLSGYPSVITIHGNMRAMRKQTNASIFSFYSLQSQIESFCLRRTRGVFCNSSYTESMVAPVAKKVWRVPNALQPEYFENPPLIRPFSSRLMILNVGVISPWKRQIEILQMAKLLWQQRLPVQWKFIGDLNLKSDYGIRFLQLLKEARELGFADYIGLKSVPELIAEYDTADALVHFPHEESFGLVVPEALARGMKVFAAAVGGLNDIAIDMRGVELLPPDDISGLENALHHWVKQGASRPTGASDLVASRYHPCVVAEKHLEIYRSVLEAS